MSQTRTWNYRVMRFTKGDESWLSVHEVHYADGIPVMYAEDPSGAVSGSNTIDDLELELGKMLQACKRPILDPVNFGVRDD